MYMGHFALGLACKRARPSVPIVVLTAASLLPDIASGIFGLVGAGQDDQVTHTLVGACIWTLLGGIAAGCAFGRTSGLLVGALVASHELLDLVTGRLLLWPGGATAGLALTVHPALDYFLEVALLMAGWIVYAGTLPRRSARLLTALILPFGALLQVAFDWLM